MIMLRVLREHKALCSLLLFCDNALFINDSKPDNIKKIKFSYQFHIYCCEVSWIHWELCIHVKSHKESFAICLEV